MKSTGRNIRFLSSIPESDVAAGKVIHEIAADVEQQSTQEGERYLTLAGSGGRGEVAMERKKQHLVWKILFFEVLVCFLMAGIVLERKRTADHIKKSR